MRIVVAALLATSVAACSDRKTNASATATVTATAVAPTPSTTAAELTSSSPPPPPPGPCPADMKLVQGRYCPAVKHECLRHTKDYEEETRRRDRLREQGLKVPPRRVPERCLKYKQPSKCAVKERRSMRFCMDDYEWPGKQGELPALLVTWTEAKLRCESVGKRLCGADEFNFACEGEDVMPYSYGYDRDRKRCNIDKPYVARRRRLHPYERCMESKVCKEHLEELDQRVPIGSTPDCTSPFGVHDLNGNVNEWVVRLGKQKKPWRSGLKGGWWGPARSRCRPMVIVHDENYAGYEVGFRCCKDI